MIHLGRYSVEIARTEFDSWPSTRSHCLAMNVKRARLFRTARRRTENWRLGCHRSAEPLSELVGRQQGMVMVVVVVLEVAVVVVVVVVATATAAVEERSRCSRLRDTKLAPRGFGVLRGDGEPEGTTDHVARSSEERCRLLVSRWRVCRGA